MKSPTNSSRPRSTPAIPCPSVGIESSRINVFGYSGGSKITFNQGTSIVVRIEGYGGDATPQCLSGGFTGESNNLNPILPCAQYNGGILGHRRSIYADFILPIPVFVSQRRRDLRRDPGVDLHRRHIQAACPAGGTTIRSMNGGVWQALPLHCSDGSLPGHCNPAATVPNQAVLSTQRYGVSTSGAPVGSSQTVEVCDNASNCSRFALGIPTCPSPVAPGNSLKLSDGNNPIEVTAGGSIDANLVLDGPWVSLDHGAGATGSTFAGAGLPSGMIVTLAPGVSGAPHTYGLMDVNVEAPPDAPPGDYSFQMKATDLASNVTLNTTVPVRILACKPTKVCSTIGLHMCGAVSNGCGGTADCGACATGVCSNGFCCPKGSFFNAAINSCQPNSCPAGKVYCPALGDCETDQVCDAANQPVCRKIGTRSSANNAPRCRGSTRRNLPSHPGRRSLRTRPITSDRRRERKAARAKSCCFREKQALANRASQPPSSNVSLANRTHACALLLPQHTDSTLHPIIG